MRYEGEGGGRGGGGDVVIGLFVENLSGLRLQGWKKVALEELVRLQGLVVSKARQSVAPTWCVMTEM